MFKSPIVVVVGAGAGVEYNMPLGAKLASDIAEDVQFQFGHYSSEPKKGDQELFNILCRHYSNDKPTLDRYTKAGNALAAAISAAVSIDDALYQLSENAEAVTLGKLCIIRSILKAERGSTLGLSQRTGRMPEDAGRDGWIEQLFSMAVAGVKQGNISSGAFRNITFINFNYDRCIEHYLFLALQRIGIDDAAATAAIAGLKMIRPYGGLGSVLQKASDYVPFGGTADPFRLQTNIRTYTESEALHDKLQLEGAMHNASLIVFLGFGFHAQNLDLLNLPESREKHIMATVKKVHEANRPAITEALVTKLQIPVYNVGLFDMTAPELLRELRLRIMMRAG